MPTLMIIVMCNDNNIATGAPATTIAHWWCLGDVTSMLALNINHIIDNAKMMGSSQRSHESRQSFDVIQFTQIWVCEMHQFFDVAV